MQTKKPQFNLGKASFIAGLIACVMLAICLKWVDEFRKICPAEGCPGLGHRLFGELWDVLFGISLFAAPPIALAGLIMAVISRLKNRQNYKKLALSGGLISALTLILYSLSFIIIALL